LDASSAETSADTKPPAASDLFGSVHLAVDLGASSGRVIAGSLRDGRLEMAVVARFPNGGVKVQEGLFWNHLGLWGGILGGLRSAADQVGSGAGQIASVGVDTWGVDFALLAPLNSRDGRAASGGRTSGGFDRDLPRQMATPLRQYRDPRNRPAMQAALEKVARDQIFNATGLQFMELNTLYQLVAAQQHGDPGWQDADAFVMAADLFHWMLTGRWTVEATNASTTQLLDPRTGTWSEAMLRAFDLPEAWFPPPISPGTTIGPVQPSVEAVTGLSGVSVVAPATHDTAAAVLAVPADEFAPPKPSWCYISSGTWSLMGVELPEPKIDAVCSELNFTNEGGVQGSTRLLKNIGGLWVFQQLRESLQRRGGAPTWDQMVAAAAEAPPFEVLLDPDAPDFLAPEDMLDAVQRYARRTGQPTPASQGGWFRAALEGLALRYAACLGMLERLIGNRIDRIHVVGGGSLNALLCQMTADACGREVVAGPVEATAIGNLLAQLIGSGSVSSVNEAREIVRRSFPTQSYHPNRPDQWIDQVSRFAALGEAEPTA